MSLPLPLCLSDIESSLPTGQTLPERRSERAQYLTRTDRMIIVALGYMPLLGVIVGLPVLSAIGVL